MPWRALAVPCALASAAALLTATPALAQSAALAGRMGDRALIVADGKTTVVGVGQSVGGLRLLRWDGDAAIVEQGGATYALRPGAAPARIGGGSSSGGAREIVIPAGTGGHFIIGGSINGQAVRFMVDTGATLVAIPQGDAARLQLDLRDARVVMTQTAAGAVPARMLSISRLRVGDVEVFNVPALVTPASMPYVLLGNSFLERFQMRRDNDVMRLERR